MPRKLSRSLEELLSYISPEDLKKFRDEHTIAETREKFNLSQNEFVALLQEYDLGYKSKFVSVAELSKIISKNELIDLCISKSRKDIAEIYNTSEANITKLREFYGIKGIGETELLCFKISKEELEAYYSTHSFKDVQKRFELNDSAARKIFKLYDIHLRDYWENISAGTPQPKRPKKKWITNGEVEYLINIDEPIPEGWIIGISEARKEKISNTEKGNPKSEHHRQAREKYIQSVRGKKHWYTNDIDDGQFFEREQPEGWFPGQSIEHRAKNSAGGTGKKMSTESALKRVATRRAKGSYKVKAETREKLRQINLGKKQSPEVKEKVIETKRKNNTFSTSKPEKEFKARIEKIFAEVEFEYKSERYPFLCDIYIPSFDLFIEFNGHWTHGTHPFNADLKEDIELLDNIKSKQDYYISTEGVRKKNSYFQLEKVWTINDAKKFEYAEKNKLNYVAIYGNGAFYDRNKNFLYKVNSMYNYDDIVTYINKYIDQIEKEEGEFI